MNPVGYHAGRKVKGIKRHVLTDHLGLPLNVFVHPASVQDREGAARVQSKQVVGELKRFKRIALR